MLAKVLCFLAFVIIAACEDGPKNNPVVVRKHGYAKRYGYGYSPRYGPGYGYGYGIGHGHLYEHGYNNHLAYSRNAGHPVVVHEHAYSEQYGNGYGPRYGPVYGPEYRHGYEHRYGPVYGPEYRHGYEHRYGPVYGPEYRHGYEHRYGHGNRYIDYYAYPRYNFGYKVVDHHTGDIKEQQEHRDGDVVKGYYALHQPDGAERVVRYYADDHVGFFADVKYGIHHLYPRYIT